MRTVKLILLMVFFAMCLRSRASAEDITTIDRQTFQNVTVIRVEPDGISIRHSSGITKIRYSNLPESIRSRFGYDVDNAQAYSVAQLKAATETQTSAQIYARKITVKLTILQTIPQGALVSASVPVIVERSKAETQNLAPAGLPNYVTTTKRWNETEYRPFASLIFVRGLSGLEKDETWEGTIYPAGTCKYTTVTDVEKTVLQYSINLQDATYATLYPNVAKKKLLKPKAPAAEGDDFVFSGTGFFITEDGYLLTNYHVVEDSSRIKVRTSARLLPAEIITSDKVLDVALLKVVGQFSALPLAPSSETKLGCTVFTIGFPNVDIQGWLPKFTKGEISSLAGIRDDRHRFQISVAVQTGNSGGPLVNENGNVVGIIVSKLNAFYVLKETGDLTQNVNYAIKGSYVSSFLDRTPDLVKKLKAANPPAQRKLEDVVGDVERATTMILGY